MIVRCHRNLHRHDWSITVKGKVIAHVAEICLRNVRFIVRETARLRVIAKHCREVHAWAEGEIVQYIPQGKRVSLSYNPYVHSTFYELATGNPVEWADYVHFTKSEGAIAIWPS